MKIERVIVIFVFMLVIVSSSFNIKNITGSAISTHCGDSICHYFEENAENCPEDCENICGDCFCEGEEEITCAKDCTDTCAKRPEIRQAQLSYVLPLILTTTLLAVLAIWFIERK